MISASDRLASLHSMVLLTSAGERDFRSAVRARYASTAARHTTAALRAGTIRGTMTLDRIVMRFDASSFDERPVSATLILNVAANPLVSAGFFMVAPDASASFPTSADTGDFSKVDTATLYQKQSRAYTVPRSASRLSIPLSDTALDKIQADETFILYLISGQEELGDPGRTAATTDLIGVNPRLEVITPSFVDQTRRTHGAPGRGFSSRNLIVTTGGKTVGNGFREF
jgi:hypothetical protein